MPYKLLSNLIKAPAVHQAGEILDLDEATAQNLLKRGIVQKVEAAVTHLFGQTKEGTSLGGKPVNDTPAPPAQPQPVASTEDDDDVPAVKTEHADAVGEAKDQHASPVPAAQQSAQAPAPPAQPQAGQPSPEQIAADADAVV